MAFARGQLVALVEINSEILSIHWDSNDQSERVGVWGRNLVRFENPRLFPRVREMQMTLINIA